MNKLSPPMMQGLAAGAVAAVAALLLRYVSLTSSSFGSENISLGGIMVLLTLVLLAVVAAHWAGGETPEGFQNPQGWLLAAGLVLSLMVRRLDLFVLITFLAVVPGAITNRRLLAHPAAPWGMGLLLLILLNYTQNNIDLLRALNPEVIWMTFRVHWFMVLALVGGHYAHYVFRR
ncbi:MAG: hypothetical protein OEV94_10040 [Deltaproteobacteria bacterium]|nr:hypothetical protein [Deltaproteobacteria bacterium]MDH4122031.1 hypothetical protein [Deltaproteobacteria bacterium]